MTQEKVEKCIPESASQSMPTIKKPNNLLSARIPENDKLRKKFSVGFPSQVSFTEFRKFIDEYEYYIHDIYTSPLGDTNYHSRKLLTQDLLPTPENTRRFYSCMEYVNKKDIFLSITYNAVMLDDKMVYNSLLQTKKRLKINSVVILKKFLEVTRELLPDSEVVFSYNNGIRTEDDLPDSSDFDYVVFGEKFLRDFSMFRKAKEKGLKVKLLLDNGCSFNCPGECFGRDGGDCNTICLANIEKDGIDYVYALQSIMPWELHQHYLVSDLIDLYKLCSRSGNIHMLDECINSYIENNNDVKPVLGFFNWAKLGSFNDHINKINYDKMILEKKAIWAGINCQ